MVTPSPGAVLTFCRFGVQLPPHDYEAYSYLNTTNNIGTIVGYSGGVNGVQVGTLTFTYVGSAAANDDLVASIALTLPTANG